MESNEGMSTAAWTETDISESTAWQLQTSFIRDGMVPLTSYIPASIRDMVASEVRRLLDGFAERRDLRLVTTDGTPRRMSVVTSQTVAEHSTSLRALYRSRALAGLLQQVTGEPPVPCPAVDEEFLIARQELPQDTHGWHWGDYAYALIWIVEAPPIECGGMLQCVPHTSWRKDRARINEYLCRSAIRTYAFESGDVYLLRTDTTLHRTVPLNRQVTRIMLNMTWASQSDLRRSTVGDDRWWEDPSVSAAHPMHSQAT